MLRPLAGGAEITDLDKFSLTNEDTEENNIMFMGTKNDPFLIVDMHGVKIAIELKKGKRGIDLKDGIAQSMIYSTYYDFVLFLFMDVSEEKRIVNAQGGVNEKSLVYELWKQWNIKFMIK